MHCKRLAAYGTNNPQTQNFGVAVAPAPLPADVTPAPILSEWATFARAALLALMEWWRISRLARRT